MIEYAIMMFKDFSFSTGIGSPELLSHFSLGGIILVAIGYWTKKWQGVIFTILAVLFSYCYFTGFFSCIMT